MFYLFIRLKSDTLLKKYQVKDQLHELLVDTYLFFVRCWSCVPCEIKVRPVKALQIDVHH